MMRTDWESHLSMVAVFPAGGAAVSGRFDGLPVTLHTVGTVALGVGIALTARLWACD